ncbi:MAG: DUF2953 domain-containing protein [Chloroflexi bacterium]|nr:DUF2953 domain-containing protein [Chloroflexota bacterium]
MLVILGLAAVAVVVALSINGLILAAPVELSFRVARGDGSRPRVRMRWLFGLVGGDLGAHGKKSAKSEPRNRWPRPRFSALGGSFEPRFALRVLKLAWRLFKKFDVREFVLRGRVGTGDPAQTGILFGISSGVTGFVNRLPNVDVRVMPDYTATVIEGEMRGTIRLVPIRLFPPLIAFFLKPSNVWAIIRLRKAGT